MLNSSIPREVIQSYYPSGTFSEVILSGGIVNTTLLITENSGRRSILQRLNPMFDESMADDFDVVSSQLKEDGWEVPTALKSYANGSYVSDSTGVQWRAFSYIESDHAAPPANMETYIALSGLLGRFHGSLSKIEYSPKFRLPHFHDTEYYLQQLEKHVDESKDNEIKFVGAKLIEQLSGNALPKHNTQLIHGDPKITNALFRRGQPFTYIDFDTLMETNPLVDVGDMLRSVAGKMLSTNPNLSTEFLVPVIEAYYKKANPGVDLETFIRHASVAAKVISLELGIRYVIDSVEESYFNWDREQFLTRKDHNLHRARLQQKISQVFQTN